MYLKTLAPCLSGIPKLLPSTSLVASPAGCLCTADSVLYLSLTSVAQASAPSPCHTDRPASLRLGAQGSLTDLSVQVTLHLASLRLVAALSSLAQSFLSISWKIPADLPMRKGLSWVQKLSSFIASSLGYSSHFDYFHFSFILLSYPVMGGFLALSGNHRSFASVQ